MGLLGSTTVGEKSLGLEIGLEGGDTVQFDLDMRGLLILTELQIVAQASYTLLSVMRSLACAS